MSTKKKSPGTPAENPTPEEKKEQAAPEQELPETETPAPEKQPESEPEKKPAEPSCEERVNAEKDKYMRLLAEYDNYRKRSARERESIYADVRADSVMKFLPVFDNLQRALDQSTQDEAYRKGVEMIMTQFREVLKGFGVSEIPAVGETFDPALHNAVMHEEDPEKGEGEIVQELQRGFKMGDKVIRFSMVKTVN